MPGISSFTIVEPRSAWALRYYHDTDDAYEPCVLTGYGPIGAIVPCSIATTVRPVDSLGDGRRLSALVWAWAAENGYVRSATDVD